VDASQDLFSILLFYHPLTFANSSAQRSLRPIFAVSTFACERIVRKFTLDENSERSSVSASLPGEWKRGLRGWLRALLLYPCDVLVEEGQRPPPGVLGGAWIVAPAPVVEEGVPRSFVDLDITWDAVALQLRVELAP
jgi:hypothetical protein